MLVRLLGKRFVNPTNIPLRRFAFATRRCPPSKWDVCLANAIGGVVVFRPHRHSPAVLRLRQARLVLLFINSPVTSHLHCVPARLSSILAINPHPPKTSETTKSNSLSPAFKSR